MTVLTLLDWLVPAVWLALWLGYQWFATRPRAGRESLSSMMVPIRRKWMLEALHRENRISDASLIGNLMHSATFFSSTTLLVLGALFAFVSSLDKNTALVSNLPFAQAVDLQTLEFKVLALAFVLIYALFRFLWSIRQFNLLTIMLGAYPAANLPSQKTGRAPLHIVAQATRLNALAGNSFAQALRAYYYAVPILLWLISPWLLLAGSIGVTTAVYYTEYRSETALALRGAEGEGEATASADDTATPT